MKNNDKKGMLVLTRKPGTIIIITNIDTKEDFSFPIKGRNIKFKEQI